MLKSILANLLLVIVFFYSNISYATQLEEAIKAFDNQDYDTASKLLKPLAEQNIPEAQYYFGFINQYDGDDTNDAQAFEWLQKSALQNEVKAQIGLADIYRDEHSPKLDYQKAIYWYKKAADQGNTSGMIGLAIMYQYGHGETNIVKAIEWFTKAAEKGDILAQNSLGNIFYVAHDSNIDLGNREIRDNQKSFYWFEKSAMQGDMIGQRSIAEMYKTGLGVTQNIDQARYWYSKAAKQGDSVSETALKNLSQ